MALCRQWFLKWSILLSTQRKGWGEEECEVERWRGDQKFYHMKGMLLSSSKDFRPGKRNGLPYMDHSLACSRIVSHNVQCMWSTCDASVHDACSLLFLWSVVVLILMQQTNSPNYAAVHNYCVGLCIDSQIWHHTFKVDVTLYVSIVVHISGGYRMTNCVPAQGQQKHPIWLCMHCDCMGAILRRSCICIFTSSLEAHSELDK